MKTYLSVDGGGTKTAFILADETGKVLSSVTLGPANYIVNSLESVIETFKNGIHQVCEIAHVDQSTIATGFIAIAGFKDIPDDVPVVTEAVQQAFPHLKLILGNDTENALAGGLLGESGIHLIAGTGSIGLGYDLDERFIRCGGWHHLFGDEGSGYWIGNQLIQLFSKEADGRLEKTLLYDYLIEHYELGCAENILELVIQRWDSQRDKVASLSKDAAYLAAQGDPVVLDLFQRAGIELASILKAIKQQGHFDSHLKVSYSGGVFKSKQHFMDTLQKELGDVEFVEPVLEPVGGGIILAMKADHTPITSSIINNLKAIR